MPLLFKKAGNPENVRKYCVMLAKHVTYQHNPKPHLILILDYDRAGIQPATDNDTSTRVPNNSPGLIPAAGYRNYDAYHVPPRFIHVSATSCYHGWLGSGRDERYAGRCACGIEWSIVGDMELVGGGIADGGCLCALLLGGCCGVRQYYRYITDGE